MLHSVGWLVLDSYACPLCVFMFACIHSCVYVCLMEGLTTFLMLLMTVNLASNAAEEEKKVQSHANMHTHSAKAES